MSLLWLWQLLGGLLVCLGWVLVVCLRLCLQMLLLLLGRSLLLLLLLLWRHCLLLLVLGLWVLWLRWLWVVCQVCVLWVLLVSWLVARLLGHLAVVLSLYSAPGLLAVLLPLLLGGSSAQVRGNGCILLPRFRWAELLLLLLLFGVTAQVGLLQMLRRPGLRNIQRFLKASVLLRCSILLVIGGSVLLTCCNVVPGWLVCGRSRVGCGGGGGHVL